MSNVLLLKIGGVFHLLCAVLHIFMPKMGDWEARLAKIPEEDRDLVEQPLYIMNLCLLVIWVIFAIIPFFYTDAILNTSLGNALLTSIVIFWIIRIFILQPYYIGIKSKISIQMILTFMIGLILFGIPWLNVVIL